jgi:hypothetical protein
MPREKSVNDAPRHHNGAGDGTGDVTDDVTSPGNPPASDSFRPANSETEDDRESSRAAPRELIPAGSARKEIVNGLRASLRICTRGRRCHRIRPDKAALTCGGATR